MRSDTIEYFEQVASGKQNEFARNVAIEALATIKELNKKNSEMDNKLVKILRIAKNTKNSGNALDLICVAILD